jgi:DNA-binding NarL/FixJ family response regulator
VIRVLVVDDEELVRSGLRALLDAETDLEVVGEARNGRHAVMAAQTLTPDVVLIGARMLDADGLEATRSITGNLGLAAVRVILTSSSPSEAGVVAAFRAGVSGLLVKDIALEALVDAVRLVAAGGIAISPPVAHHLVSEIRAHRHPAARDAADRIETLTDREREVVSLVAAGMSNREIAEQLYITRATVKTHIARVLGKAGLRNRTQLVGVAYAAGSFPSSDMQLVAGHPRR